MYSFTSRIRYSEIDESGRLSAPSLIDYFQDCSTFHSESVGRGLAHVRESGHAWMLAAWDIEIDEMPRFSEEVLVGTWATRFKGLMANRFFVMCRADDVSASHPLVHADSRWFMFDVNAGRPVRVPESEASPYKTPGNFGEPLEMPPLVRHIPVEGKGVPGTPVVVTGAHIDTNHHVNNAQYVSIALGALPPEVAIRLRHLDVSYSVAAKLGDTVYPQVHEASEGIVVALNDACGQPYAVVRVCAD